MHLTRGTKSTLFIRRSSESPYKYDKLVGLQPFADEKWVKKSVSIFTLFLCPIGMPAVWVHKLNNFDMSLLPPGNNPVAPGNVWAHEVGMCGYYALLPF